VAAPPYQAINEGVATECHPYKFHSFSKHVAINEGVATECHPYRFHSLSEDVANQRRG
jgi:hypothetical protein